MQPMVRHRAARPTRDGGGDATPTFSSVATVNIGPRRVYREATLAPHRVPQVSTVGICSVGARSVIAETERTSGAIGGRRRGGENWQTGAGLPDGPRRTG